MRIYFHELREDAARDLEELLDGFDPRAPADRLVTEVKQVCLHLHTVAVATLLLEGQVQDFHLNLCRAAENWRRLLTHLRSHGQPLPPATDNTPLLGAMAAGHWELAQALARDSTHERQEEEYPDDFDWAVLLQELVLAETGAPHRLDEQLQRLETSGARTHAERLEVVRALKARDAAAFITAFEAAVVAQGMLIEELAGTFTTPVRELAPYRYLWFDGLALLRLAERLGLPCREERFLYCPWLARLPMRSIALEDWDWVVPLAA